MIKRSFDILFSFLGIIILLPIFLLFCLMVFFQDFHSPFYIAGRVGEDGKIFNMIKIRSMIIDAASTGVQSTGANDNRITPLGKMIRKFKLDELSQLINVFIGDMSFVGPRPNVREEVDLYTEIEMKLVSVKPGITDFASIIFSDEGEILSDKPDPDLSYNQLIRPWKSRLGILYIEKKTLLIDLKLILITGIAIINKQKAIDSVLSILEDIECSEELLKVSKRDGDLYPYPPPGSDKIVTER